MTHVSFAEYRAIEAHNWSNGKWILESPLHYRYQLAHPKPSTPSQVAFQAVHTAVLEPDQFARRYALCDVRRDKRTAPYQEWLATHPDAAALNAEEWAACTGAADAIRAHPKAGPLVAPGEGVEFECSIVWTDEATGFRCKARLDILRHLPDRVRVVDLKDVGSTDERHLRLLAEKLLWYGQLAHYCAGAEWRYPGLPVEAYLLCVESKPPHDVAVLHLNEDGAFAKGREMRASAFARLAECLESGKWPGRHEDVIPAPFYGDGDDNETTYTVIEED